jgi:hypothetical protein
LSLQAAVAHFPFDLFLVIAPLTFLKQPKPLPTCADVRLISFAGTPSACPRDKRAGHIYIYIGCDTDFSGIAVSLPQIDGRRNSRVKLRLQQWVHKVIDGHPLVAGTNDQWPNYVLGSQPKC